MRKLLLLGTTVLFVSFGAIGAKALSPNEQAADAAVSQRLQTANPAAPLIAERADFAYDSGVQAVVVGRDWDGGTFRKDIKTIGLSAVLLGIAGLVFGLSSVGVKALWVVDQTEYPVYEVMKQRLNASAAWTEERSA
jgi:hypothetical protein